MVRFDSDTEKKINKIVGKGKEKSSAARVSCALVYWQFPAVGRAEEEKEQKVKGGKKHS
jgi:hypothetical protein